MFRLRNIDFDKSLKMLMRAALHAEKKDICIVNAMSIAGRKEGRPRTQTSGPGRRIIAPMAIDKVAKMLHPGYCV